MKKLLMLGVALVFMFGIGFSSIAADKNKVNELVNMIQSGKVNLWADDGVKKVMHVYENTGQHDKFETTFKKHYAIVDKHPAGFGYLTLIVRDYQDYYTIHDAQGFILVILVDYNKDGIVDDWRKDYLILLDGDYFLIPNYPPGYLNHDWFKMSREEAQKIFDEELNFMLNNADKAKLAE
jgi:hypothetical protein